MRNVTDRKFTHATTTRLNLHNRHPVVAHVILHGLLVEGNPTIILRIHNRTETGHRCSISFRRIEVAFTCKYSITAAPWL
jgi:hypothetical protein